MFIQCTTTFPRSFDVKNELNWNKYDVMKYNFLITNLTSPYWRRPIRSVNNRSASNSIRHSFNVGNVDSLYCHLTIATTDGNFGCRLNINLRHLLANIGNCGAGHIIHMVCTYFTILWNYFISNIFNVNSEHCFFVLLLLVFLGGGGFVERHISISTETRFVFVFFFVRS